MHKIYQKWEELKANEHLMLMQLCNATIKKMYFNIFVFSEQYSYVFLLLPLRVQTIIFQLLADVLIFACYIIILSLILNYLRRVHLRLLNISNAFQGSINLLALS